MQDTSPRRYIVNRTRLLSPDTAVAGRSGRRLPYLPGVDGLRALAVLAVLAYHSDVPWLPGGFLGVEVFFVISGYLITALLLAEIDETGSIRLGSFWARRARRLLPALGLFLVGTMVLAVAFAPDVVTKVALEIPAALAYVYNWFAIAADQSYFESFGRPSFLQHLWSLAIEEQFYLIWPIVLMAGLKLLGRRGTLVMTAAAIAGSTLLMAWMFVPFTDPSRLYYGTDTRAAGLLIGSGLAFLWDPRRVRRTASSGPLAPWLIDTVGAVGLGALVVSLIVLRDDAIGAPALYGGGFFVVGVATALVIAAAAAPQSRIGRLVGNRVFQVVGVRSYAIYLWHWPIFLVTRPRVDVGIEGMELFALRLALTLIAAEISYRLVERPVREGRFMAGLERVVLNPFRWRTLVRSAATVGAVVLVVGSLLGVQGSWRATIAAAEARVAAAAPELAALPELDVPESPASSGEPPAPTLRQSGISPSPTTTSATGVPSAAQDHRHEPDGGIGGGASPADASALGSTAPPLPENDGEGAATAPAGEEATSEDDGENVVAAEVDSARAFGAFNALGDSVMLGATGALEAVGLETLNAEVGRQWWEAADVAASMRRRGQAGGVFVLHLGHNGTLTAEMFDDVMQQLVEAERVVVLTVSVPRRWEGSVNEELAAGVARWPSAVLVDWHGIAAGRPELTSGDGVHLSSAGRDLYASLIAEAVGR